MAHGNHVSGTCCHNDANKTNPSARSLPPSQSYPWWSNGDERGNGLPAPRKSPNPMERRSTAPFQVQYPDRIVSRSLGEIRGVGLQLFFALLVQIVRNRVCELRTKHLCPGDQDFGGEWGASQGLPAFPSWQVNLPLLPHFNVQILGIRF